MCNWNLCQHGKIYIGDILSNWEHGALYLSYDTWYPSNHYDSFWDEVNLNSEDVVPDIGVHYPLFEGMMSLISAS